MESTPLWAEYVSDILIHQIKCSGVVISDKRIKDKIIINPFDKSVKGYLPEIKNKNKQINLAEIQEVFSNSRESLLHSNITEEDLGSWQVSLTEIPDTDWDQNWKKYWHPQKISEKVVICPTWEEYTCLSDEIVINLDPGSAFGTGTHPTTRLCVEALEQVIPRYTSNPLTMADIGTGSGILAIAGIKLGVDSVVGVDNDESVISVAIDNASKNNMANKCQFFAGVASSVEGKYELVVANILAHIIIEAMPELINLVKTDGTLILSGIIEEKEQDVIKSVKENGFHSIEVLHQDQWVSVIAKK